MAGGPWSPFNIGQGRPGLFINFVPDAIAAISPAAIGVVGTILKAPWGPDNSVNSVFGYNDSVNYYGTSETAPFNAHYSLFNMFYGGARQVNVYRIEGAGAAKATHNFTDTQGAPVNAFRIDGKYNGARGNNFMLVIQANAVDTTKTDVILYEGTQQLAIWTNKNVNRGVAGHIADIVATINNDSNNYWVTATLTGVDTGTTTSTPASVASPGVSLTGGGDGAAPLMADYVNAMNALEGTYWNTFHADVLDSDITGISTAFKNWIAGMRGYGKYVTWVTGSALGESTATTLANIIAFNNEYTHYVYPGVKQLDVNGNLVTKRGAAAAAQLAGARASLPPGKGLTYYTLQNVVDLEVRLNNPSLVALDNGMAMALFYDGTFFRVDKGNTTLVNPSNSVPNKTLPDAFKNVGAVNTSDAIATAVTASANANYIGQIPNDNEGQRALLSVIRDFLRFMQGQRAIKAGYSVQIDPNYQSTGSKVFLAWQIIPVQTMDYIYNTVVVGQ